MILYLKLPASLLVLLAMLGLAACDPVSLTLGAGAATGIGAYQERGIEGVARDNIQAYKWIALGKPGEEVDKAQLLGLLEQLMSPEEVAEGRRLAEEWLAAFRNKE